jgi:hypothetical protein
MVVLDEAVESRSLMAQPFRPAGGPGGPPAWRKDFRDIIPRR